MNGTSGAWVDVNVLAPLELSRDDVWITDCLDTYRTSVGVRNRLRHTYDRGRSAFGWPAWDLPVHPSESEIVTEAVTEHEDRLRSELQACRPERVITLGNAALRVFRHLCRSGPKKLVADVTYGSALDAGVDGRTVQWLPLAHPAAPKPYQAAHVAWIQRFARRDET
jgi:uracil-DNA glycosylase